MPEEQIGLAQKRLDWIMDNAKYFGTGKGGVYSFFVPDHEDMGCAIDLAMKEGTKQMNHGLLFPDHLCNSIAEHTP